MDNKFCPKCGHEITDGTGKCANCGFDFSTLEYRTKPKKRKPLIIAVVAVVLIIVCGFTWSVISVGGNFSELLTIYRHGSISCLVNHDWVDATCTEAKHCIKCGFSEGEKNRARLGGRNLYRRQALQSMRIQFGRPLGA